MVLREFHSKVVATPRVPGGIRRTRRVSRGETRHSESDTPSHIDDLEGQIVQLRQALWAGPQPQPGLLEALQTIPGLDEAGAAMPLVKSGDDMQAFGLAEKLAAWASVCPSGKA
jgi:transposase